ncbi:uncharacterized protein BDZ99DRAFT_526588 [Mytilinidion resinicola]|uniref:Uncharacterized protein n=1 Tax=Mytilinidion resinicola TaxID=574789 RepID=A0A6A6Y6M7_9PEZI|nr:uncharacterized protein BDZ99DRAFT_526588 [Mytilinidion resinicola]KAF2803674.1 hypothetical protein BDZ99DRAFT_526588 [Mytilinidion resinicola]
MYSIRPLGYQDTKKEVHALLTHRKTYTAVAAAAAAVAGTILLAMLSGIAA